MNDTYWEDRYVGGRENAEKMANQIADAAEAHGWLMDFTMINALSNEILLATSQDALGDFLTALARGIHSVR